jgi:hypothetical protein
MADLNFRGSGEADLRLRASTPEEEAKKAAEAAAPDPSAPLGAPTISKEEEEKNEADARRFLVTGGATPAKDQLTPDDAAIKRVVDEHYERVLAESKDRIEKRGPIAGHRELTDTEKDMVARNNWAMIAKDRSTWRTLNDDDKLGMMRLGLKDHKEVQRIRDTYEESTSWYKELGHAGWGYIKSRKIGRYPSIGQVLGAFDGGATSSDERMEQNDKQRIADTKLFWATLKEFKANPKAYRKEVVDGLIEKVKKNPDLLTKTGMKTDPEFQAVLSSFNRIEMADFMMALKEEVPSVERRVRQAKGESYALLRAGTDMAPLRITDFDLEGLDEGISWQEKLYNSSLVDPNLKTVNPKKQKLVELTPDEKKAYEVYANRAGLQGKINPTEWMTRAWGNGMFDNGDNITVNALKDVTAKGVNFTSVGVLDASISGAEMLGRQVFGPALDPTSPWGHLKSLKVKDWWSMINGDPSLADPKVLVSNFDAAMMNQDEIEKITRGEKSHIIARAGARFLGTRQKKCKRPCTSMAHSMRS